MVSIIHFLMANALMHSIFDEFGLSLPKSFAKIAAVHNDMTSYVLVIFTG